MAFIKYAKRVGRRIYPVQSKATLRRAAYRPGMRLAWIALPIRTSRARPCAFSHIKLALNWALGAGRSLRTGVSTRALRVFTQAGSGIMSGIRRARRARQTPPKLASDPAFQHVTWPELFT